MLVKLNILIFLFIKPRHIKLVVYFYHHFNNCLNHNHTYCFIDVEDTSVSQHAVCRTLEREVNSLSIGRYHGNPHPHAPTTTNDISLQERL